MHCINFIIGALFFSLSAQATPLSKASDPDLNYSSVAEIRTHFLDEAAQNGVEYLKDLNAKAAQSIVEYGRQGLLDSSDSELYTAYNFFPSQLEAATQRITHYSSLMRQLREEYSAATQTQNGDRPVSAIKTDATYLAKLILLQILKVKPHPELIRHYEKQLVSFTIGSATGIATSFGLGELGIIGHAAQVAFVVGGSTAFLTSIFALAKDTSNLSLYEKFLDHQHRSHLRSIVNRELGVEPPGELLWPIKIGDLDSIEAQHVQMLTFCEALLKTK